MPTANLLRDIALFVEVVRTRSFTRAADHLEMPAPTLSRRVSRLEAAIGLQLLTRTTRRVALTEAGAAYYARCEPLIEEASLAHEQLAQLVHVATGTLRLACPADFAALRLAPVLVDFTNAHSAVRVELLLNRRGDLVGDNLDAAIRVGSLSDSSLVTRRVGGVRHELYAAPSYVARVSSPAVPADLTRHECIRMTGDQHATQWRLTPTGAAFPVQTVRVPVAGRFVAGSMSMVRELTLLGVGIGAIDVQLARRHVEEGTLLRVLPDWALPDVPVHFVTPSRLMPARVRLFAEWLAGRLSDATASAPVAATLNLQDERPAIQGRPRTGRNRDRSEAAHVSARDRTSR